MTHGTPVSDEAPLPRASYSDAARADALRVVNGRRTRPWRIWLEWAKSLQIAILLSLVVRSFLVEAFKIPSGSMEHTLLVGDFLLVNKLVYGAEVPFTGRRLPALRSPTRGDVIVFQYPEDPEKNFVKRLVGTPGDTLEMRGGALLLNGARQLEQYAEHNDPSGDASEEQFRWQRGYLLAATGGRYRPSRNNWGPLVVPARHYFVLGDNRDNSLDSRYWGFVPDSLVRGQPLFVYYSYAPDTTDRFDWLTRVRWARLGASIE